MAAGANSASHAGNVRLRQATSGDEETLRRLINAAFVVEQAVFDGDRVDDCGVRAYMSSGTFLLAEDSAGPAGCVYVETHGARSYLGLLSVEPARHLGLLSVEPARQSLGLGRKLVIAAEEFARDSGSRVMDLRVISARGKQLLPFYQRLGYEFLRTEPFPSDLVTKIPGHYILMSKPLV